MLKTSKDIYLQETEIKPNRYAQYVLACTTFMVVLCWVLTEIGIFRVGKTEMRIGSALTFIVSVVPLVLITADKKYLSDPMTKYIIITAASFFAFCVNIFLTFHTTILLLFPILFAMLYRSKKVGIIATIASISCTVFSPIIGYLLKTWDIPLFEELILIGTDGGVANIVGGSNIPSWVNVGKIVLYLVFPRLMMVGACAVLLFNNIRIGVDHVNNQILLNQISQVDSLTGVYNQNCYRDFVNSIKCMKPHRVGILFFDVNNLKEMNDKYGHEYGDLLLKRCAQSLLNVCNDDSVIPFRVGGDEFLIYFKDATDAIVNQKVSEWENELAKINEENKSLYEGVVCSMAVGFSSGSNNQVEEVIRTADTYMYQNKARMKENMRKESR